MTIPEVIPIAYEPDYRTSMIGGYSGGQFLASITWAFREGISLAGGWHEHKRLYAVLHRFDHDGHYLGSDIRFAGTWAEKLQYPSGEDPVSRRSDSMMTDMLNSLPDVGFGSIAIRPFQVTFEDVVFGLIIERHGEDEDEDDWAELYPDRLGFHEPWDGTYDT